MSDQSNLFFLVDEFGIQGDIESGGVGKSDCFGGFRELSTNLEVVILPFGVDVVLPCNESVFGYRNQEINGFDFLL